MKGFRNLLARLKLQLLCKRYKPFAISLPGDIVKTRNILVCLPSSQRELTMIKQLLPDLSRVFAGSEIYIMASPRSTVYGIFPRKGFRIMTPSSSHVSWAGLANKKYIRLLQEHKYDVILDLNLHPNYFVQSVLLAFPQAIRIGKVDGPGVPYYNLEIKTRFIRDERNIYKSIIDTIDKLKNQAAPIDETT